MFDDWEVFRSGVLMGGAGGVGSPDIIGRVYLNTCLYAHMGILDTTMCKN